MNKKQCVFILVFTLFAGTIGGVFSNQFFKDKLVFGQKITKDSKVIEAQMTSPAIAQEAARYTISMPNGKSSNDVLLLDKFTGQTWRYESVDEVSTALQSLKDIDLIKYLNSFMFSGRWFPIPFISSKGREGKYTPD